MGLSKKLINVMTFGYLLVLKKISEFQGLKYIRMYDRIN